MKTTKRGKSPGVTVTVSTEAFELISKKALDSKPRMNKRETVNTILRLDKAL